MCTVVYAVQIQPRESQKLLTNDTRPLHFLAEAIRQFIDIKFYRRENNRGKYGDWFHITIIDDKDSYISSSLIMFTCATLRHAYLEGQRIKGVHRKPS